MSPTRRAFEPRSPGEGYDLKGRGFPFEGKSVGKTFASDFFVCHGFYFRKVTLQGTNISPKKWHFEDDFPFPQGGIC